MIPGDLAAGAAMITVAACAAVQARVLGPGTLAEPGAGFFPLIGALVLAASGVAVAVSGTTRGRGAPSVAAATGANRDRNWRIVACVAALVAYGAALSWIGFTLATFGLLVLLSRLDPRNSWRSAIIIGFLGSLGFHVLFVRLLAVYFPRDTVGF